MFSFACNFISITHYNPFWNLESFLYYYFKYYYFKSIIPWLCTHPPTHTQRITMAMYTSPTFTTMAMYTSHPAIQTGKRSNDYKLVII